MLPIDIGIGPYLQKLSSNKSGPTFYRATPYTACISRRPVSVCLSVILVYCIQTAKDIIQQFHGLVAAAL